MTKLHKIGAWALARLREPSTWAGFAILATSFGYATVGNGISGLAQALPMILGTGLMAATTSNEKPASTEVGAG